MKGCTDEMWPTCIYTWTCIQFDAMLLKKAFHIFIIFYHFHVHMYIHGVHFSVVQIAYTLHGACSIIHVLRTLSAINAGNCSTE